MQDKIQEISELIDVYAGILAEMEIENRYDTDMHHNCSDAWFNIESKLRELVREPLTPTQRMEILQSIPDDDDADSEWMLTDMQLQLIMDGVERAHNITNTSENQ